MHVAGRNGFRSDRELHMQLFSTPLHHATMRQQHGKAVFTLPYRHVVAASDASRVSLPPLLVPPPMSFVLPASPAAWYVTTMMGGRRRGGDGDDGRGVETTTAAAGEGSGGLQQTDEAGGRRVGARFRTTR